MEEEAILIAYDPYLIVSVFIITGSSNVTVACGDPQNEVQLSTFVTMTDPEITSRSTTLGKLNLYMLSDFS